MTVPWTGHWVNGESRKEKWRLDGENCRVNLKERLAALRTSEAASIRADKAGWPVLSYRYLIGGLWPALVEIRTIQSKSG